MNFLLLLVFSSSYSFFFFIFSSSLSGPMQQGLRLDILIWDMICVFSTPRHVLSTNRWDSYPLVWCVSPVDIFDILFYCGIERFQSSFSVFSRITGFVCWKTVFCSLTSGMRKTTALKWPPSSILLAHPHLSEWVQLTGILHWAKGRPYWCQLNSDTTSDVCLNLWLPLCLYVDSPDIHALQMEKRWKSCQRSIKN